MACNFNPEQIISYCTWQDVEDSFELVIGINHVVVYFGLVIDIPASQVTSIQLFIEGNVHFVKALNLDNKISLGVLIRIFSKAKVD